MMVYAVHMAKMTMTAIDGTYADVKVGDVILGSTVETVRHGRKLTHIKFAGKVREYKYTSDHYAPISRLIEQDDPDGPTLGDVYAALKKLVDDGVTVESIQWVLDNQLKGNA